MSVKKMLGIAGATAIAGVIGYYTLFDNKQERNLQLSRERMNVHEPSLAAAETYYYKGWDASDPTFDTVRFISFKYNQNKDGVRPRRNLFFHFTDQPTSSVIVDSILESYDKEGEILSAGLILRGEKYTPSFPEMDKVVQLMFMTNNLFTR